MQDNAFLKTIGILAGVGISFFICYMMLVFCVIMWALYILSTSADSFS